MATLSLMEVGFRENMQAQLSDLIRRNGKSREDERYDHLEELARGEVAEVDPFAADLVMRDEDGFELWIGSFEDALNLTALGQRGVNAVLNCAQEDCVRECATFRPYRGRSRCHARGPSAMNEAAWHKRSDADSDGVQGGGPDCGSLVQEKALTREQVRAQAIFDGAWYASMLGYDMAYLGFTADDEPEYPIARHFPEALAFLERCRAERRKVLVHCIMGINRSAAVLAAFLCSGLSMGLVEAVALTSRSRGLILSNDSFLEQLVEEYGRQEDSDVLGTGNSSIQHKCSFAADLPRESIYTEKILASIEDPRLCIH